MTPITSLLLPIVVAAVAVFVVSMIVHVAMPWHQSDYGNVPNDDAAIAAVQSLNLAPDDYAVPNPRLPGGGKNPDFIAKFERGLPLLGDRHRLLVWIRRLAALDLVSAEVVDGVQGNARWHPLRPGDRGGLHVDVAESVALRLDLPAGRRSGDSRGAPRRLNRRAAPSSASCRGRRPPRRRSRRPPRSAGRRRCRRPS